MDSHQVYPPSPEPPAAPEGGPYQAAFPPPPTTPAPPAGPRRHRLLWAAAAFLSIALLLVGSGAVIGIAAERAQHRTAALAPIRPLPQQPGISIPGLGGAASTGGASAAADAIAAKVAPAVVDVDTVVQGVAQNGEAAGTGMILTSGGEVLTNNHVVEGATSISVTIQGRDASYKAHVVGTDPADDVALIQIEGVSGLPTVKVADSSTLSVGQSVVAIGNAFGRGGTPSVTEGTITALDQTITASDGPGSNSEQLSGMIQTDASISPGDSGGPLVNSSAQVVGMITAGQSSGFRRRAAATSIGFAIPASSALAIVNQIRSGHPTNPSIVLGQTSYLGVSVRDLDAATAAQLGLSVTAGALVVGVVADSPAAQIGITQNAVITSVGGTRVDSTAALGPAIRAHKPGSKVAVTWVDGSGSHTATATLVAGPAV